MSGNNANHTINTDFSHWRMYWGNGGGIYNFQLDIVGFLAVLGESSVTANAQVAALSRLFYLPRLLPAPQALLPPTRAVELPSRKAWVTSVTTGNMKEHIHHVPNILFGQELIKHEVRCVRVIKKRLDKPTLVDTIFRGVQRSRSKNQDEEEEERAPPVKAKATGPLTWVTLTGFFLSVSLFTISMVLGDGYSMVATLLLSFLSTLIGIANKWTLKLAKRTANGDPDPGDTVIRNPNGSFLIVRCGDDIARELFFAPEEIDYGIKSSVVYRIISLLATLILMLGIIFLANARLQLQFAWAASYGIINAAHWAAAALPAKSHWDMSCYDVIEEGVEDGPYNKVFTNALWKAILLSQGTDWLKQNGTPPTTPIWDDWVKEAKKTLGQEPANLLQRQMIKPKGEWVQKYPEGTIIWRNPKGWDAKDAYDAIALSKKNPHAPSERAQNNE